MKKNLIFVGLFLVAFYLTACGEKSPASKEDVNEVSETVQAESTKNLCLFDRLRISFDSTNSFDKSEPVLLRLSVERESFKDGRGWERNPVPASTLEQVQPSQLKYSRLANVKIYDHYSVAKEICGYSFSKRYTVEYIIGEVDGLTYWNCYKSCN